ncbi:MAG: MarR family transcriptional regulator [Nanoarchaeota archaeon]|nr:MarR family transcriptional regulator [Nanoarchaeota archaeon]MBU4242458.1 MarR family transcriptional regulator [Nanoarchaeota archaeon]MBU4352431.1 MarR family transcriptional regulator [Nanoarchaeota archaeon]
MKTIEIEELSWIKRGKQRREIIVHIKGLQTPTEIAKDSGYSLNHTSRILNELKKHKFVKILNPKAKTGRLYQLTERGKIIKDKIKE